MSFYSVFLATRWDVWPWRQRVVSRSPRGKEAHSSDWTTSTHSDMYEQEHTLVIPITRFQQGNSQQPDPAMESQVCAGVCVDSLCVCVCVCVRVYLHACAMKSLRSREPCRVLGVLIRQPQPSRVHHRENRGERERGWRKECAGKPAKNSAHLLRWLAEWEMRREEREDVERR